MFETPQLEPNGFILVKTNGIARLFLEYFKGEEDTILDFEMRDLNRSLLLKFCNTIISCPRNISRNYNETTNTYILTIEEIVDEKIVERNVTFTTEDVEILKRANDIIMDLDVDYSKKSLIQLNVAIDLKTRVFGTKFQNINFPDVAHLHLMKGVILAMNMKNVSDALPEFCKFMEVLVNLPRLEEPDYQYLLFLALKCAINCYHAIYQPNQHGVIVFQPDKIDNEILDQFYTILSCIVKDIKLKDSKYAEVKVKAFLYFAQLHYFAKKRRDK